MRKTLTLLTAFVIVAIFSQISYGEEKNITMAEANAIAIKVIPGEIVKTEREKGYYEIKIRTSKVGVEKVYVDAKDGNIMKMDKKVYNRHKDEDGDLDNDHHSHHRYGEKERGKDRDSNSD